MHLKWGRRRSFSLRFQPLVGLAHYLSLFNGDLRSTGSKDKHWQVNKSAHYYTHFHLNKETQEKGQAKRDKINFWEKIEEE